MFRRLIIISGLLLFLLIAAAAWNIHQAGKPMNADEIPQWESVQETQDSILLQILPLFIMPEQVRLVYLYNPCLLIVLSKHLVMLKIFLLVQV